MSEFTYGSLANIQYREKLRCVVPEGTAICQLNEDWIAFFPVKTVKWDLHLI